MTSPRLAFEDPTVVLLFAYPEAEDAFNAFGHAVLRGPSSLTPGERELIAAYVSARNGCGFCAAVHAATARQLLGDRAAAVDDALADPNRLEPKLQVLVAVADRIRANRSIDADVVARARDVGLDDRAVHDAVLVAATFSMVNRYIDGFGPAPADPSLCGEIATRFAGGDGCAVPVVVGANSF